jgi:hypothetical protein
VCEALTKGGDAICRCGVDEQRNDRSLEVPAWMFEPAVCDHLRVSDAPFVDGQALLALKTAVETATRADVLRAQHHFLPTAGGADAKAQTPIISLATDAVSSAAAPRNFRCCRRRSRNERFDCSPDCCAYTWIKCPASVTRGRRIMSDKIRPQHVARKAIL